MGISGINLSLDTLRRERFVQITRRDNFDAVMKTFQQIIERGIALKINIVVQEGVNTDEIVSIAKLAQTYPIEVRFIEQMPFNGRHISATVHLRPWQP